MFRKTDTNEQLDICKHPTLILVVYKSLENASDAIIKDIEIKEQEVIEIIHQESIHKFGLG